MPPADAPGFCKEICRFQRPKSGAVNAKTKSILAFTILLSVAMDFAFERYYGSKRQARLKVTNSSLLSYTVLPVHKFFRLYVRVPVSCTAFFILMVDSILRAVLQAGTAAYTVTVKMRGSLCKFNIFHGTDPGTESAAGTGSTDSQFPGDACSR